MTSSSSSSQYTMKGLNRISQLTASRKILIIMSGSICIFVMSLIISCPVVHGSIHQRRNVNIQPYVVSSSNHQTCSGITTDHSFQCIKGRNDNSYQPLRHNVHEVLHELRGGASKKKTSNKNKSRTGSLHASSASSVSKTATGKLKVGAAQRAEKEAQQSAFNTIVQKYKRILPITRLYITLIGIVTIIGLVLGEEMTQSLFALDPIRSVYGFEFWRYITAASFLGPPSIGWLMSGYYLFQYGTSLERAYGSAQFCIFLLSQIIILSGFSILLGQPFFASSMITAMLHVLSRSMPYQNVKWLVFTVPYWSLPYGLMATDVLQAQNGLAALPHVLGILSGHFYQFHKYVWPKMNPGTNEDWLVSPTFLSKKLDPDSHRTSSAAKESLSKALKGRKRNKGRKLGT